MRHKLLFALLAIVFIATSCSKSGKTGLLVPKDAGYVVYINTPSISSKLSWDEIKKSTFFTNAQNETTDSVAKRLLNDPSSSGIDVKAPFVFFTKKQGNGGYMAVQGKIADSKAFEKTLGDVKEKKLTISKGDGFSYTSLEDDAVLTWTSDKFILLGNMRPTSLTGSYSDSKNFGTDSLLVFVKNTYKLSGSKLLDSDSRFTKLIKSEGDIHFWMASEHTYTEDAMSSSLKLDRLMKGNVTAGTAKFENGKIAVHFDQYYNKELENIFKKHSNGSITAALTSRLPANAPVAGAMTVPFPAINDMLKLLGIDVTANLFLANYGLTVEGITKAFKGDMAFALSGFESKKDTIRFGTGNGPGDMYVYDKRDPSFIFGAAIGDQKAYTQVYTTLEDEFLKDKPASIQVINEKDWLIIGNNETDIAAFRAGSSKPAYADRLIGHQFGLYADIRQIISTFKPEGNDPEKNKAYELSLNTWETVWATSDSKDGRYTTDIEINLSNKQINSLKQLHDYATQLIPQKEEYEDNVYIVPDSAGTEPPSPAPVAPKKN